MNRSRLSEKRYIRQRITLDNTTYMLYFVITKQKWRQHMILHNYLSNSGRDLIYEYINSLPEAEKN